MSQSKGNSLPSTCSEQKSYNLAYLQRKQSSDIDVIVLLDSLEGRPAHEGERQK
jgi:hypothetical protein